MTQPRHAGDLADERPIGAHGAIFFSSPSLPPDVPRTPGRRQMASQPAVSTGHPATLAITPP